MSLASQPWTSIVLLWLAAALAMTLGWLWQQRHRNAGIVDVIWAGGVGAGAVYYAVIGDGAFWPRLLLGLLGGLWGLRLAWHLYTRFRGEDEDGRYRALRGRWGKAPLKYFAMFQFQALLITLFALPFAGVARNATVQPVWLLVGVAIWLVSVVGESVADRQLARFRADPDNAGRTCRAGLWKLSRHPNYFFEWLHWFAYIALAAGSPWWWLAGAGPIAMYAFLRWISGVPYTEAQAVRNRGEDYRRYQRETPMLIPWIGKKGAP